MPQWRKFATSFVENHCYLFVTVSNLSKPATLADNLSYDKARLEGPRSARVPDQR